MTTPANPSALDPLWLAAIVESSDDAIVSKDLNGTIRSWNQAAERLFGYAPHEAIGRSIRLIIPPDRQSEEDDILARIARGEAVDHYETKRQRRDGTLVDVSLSISPVRGPDGRVLGAAKIVRDVTAQKRAAERESFLAQAGAALSASLDSEATLKAIADLAVQSVADWCAVDIVTEDGRIEVSAVAHADPAKADLAGVIHREEVADGADVIRSGSGVFIGRVADRPIDEQTTLMRALDLRSYISVPLIVRGRTLGALSVATAESGRSYGRDDFRFVQDVAFRIGLAVDTAQAYKAAQTANQLKDEFIATLSHELRTPLNAVLGYSRLIKTGVATGDKQTRALDVIERNAVALTQIVDDVLDVSRIIVGKLRVEMQPVEVADVVTNAVDTLRPTAEGKRLNLQTTIDDQTGRVYGDADRLHQIISNLVSNAIKFTPESGSVHVKVRRVGPYAEIVVADTGIGIKPDFVPHIFERFRQADSGSAREHGGLGLGLAIVRHLVELHRGSIEASSEGPGRGSTFSVRLPLVVSDRDAARRPKSDPTRLALPSGNGRPPLRGKSVLIVDDEADAVSLAREILEAAGAEVVAASSAAEALDLIQRRRPDAIVSDIGLPGADGFELIARIRALSDEATRDVPAAALTAYARWEERVKALNSGFQIHLSKPIEPAELVSAVSALTKL